METKEATRKVLPLHGNPNYGPIGFSKDPIRDVIKKKRAKKPMVKKPVPVPAQETTEHFPAPHPKQVLLNFFEWRTGIEYCYYDDGNFYIVEVLCADEPATFSLMEDLVKIPNPFHYHFRPGNNRLKVYIDKDI